jgi:predicted regulator of Ras-like GTPase activity (Roadblock/LC7/MglB family)
MSKQEILTNEIENLCSAIPELHGVLLASADGLPIAHSLTNGSDPTRLAAMAVAAANLGIRVTEAIDTGTVSEVNVRASDGDLFVYSLNGKAVLAVLGPKGANAGLIHLESRNTAEQLANLFG